MSGKKKKRIPQQSKPRLPARFAAGVQVQVKPGTTDPEIAADQLADLVNRLGCEAVALDLEALQVLGEPHLEAEDFQDQVGLLQQGLPLPGVLGPDQDFQQVVQVPFDPFAQHEAVVAGEFARVVARPQDQVIRLRDDDQFFVSFQVGHIRLLYSVHMYKSIFHFRPLRR